MLALLTFVGKICYAHNAKSTSLKFLGANLRVVYWPIFNSILMTMKTLKTLRNVLATVLFGGLLIGQANATETVRGKVLEVKNTDSYTYLLLKVDSKDTWVAVQLSKVKVGSTVTVENPMEMKDFESKALKKTFPSILFGNLAGGDAGTKDKPHGAATADLASMDVKVAKATGTNGQTVADVVNNAAALNNKSVEVHAKVVKVNFGIMGKNWVHLRDGTGKADDGSNDILLTTTAETTVGSTVTAVGTVRTNKDFGSGYAYKVMLEDVKFKP
jgi:hypothetical protein